MAARYPHIIIKKWTRLPKCFTGLENKEYAKKMVACKMRDMDIQENM